MASQVAKDRRTILGTNIRAARQARGLTQRELAALVNGVDTLAVSRWERGKAIPTEENFAALCEALGHDYAWFYTDHAGALAA